MAQCNRETISVVKITSNSDCVPKLHLRGHPRLIDSQGQRVEMTSKKAVAVLGLLALANDGIRSRAWLQQKLWGSRDAKQAQNSLRRELANMRKALPCVPLVSDHRSVRLDLEAIWVDVRDDPAAASSGDEDFLEGLDIAGEEDFEEWLRDARSQIAADGAGEVFADEEDEGRAPPASSGSRSFTSTTAPEDPAVGDKWRSPTIVVMALHDSGGRREDGAVLQLLTQELNAGLARLGWLQVVAAPPTPGSLDDGVRYALSASLIPTAPGSLLSLSCIEMPQRRILWSDTSPLPHPLQHKDLNLRVGRTVNALENAIANACRSQHAEKGEQSDHQIALHGLRSVLRRVFAVGDIDHAEQLLKSISAQGEHPELDIFRAIHALRSYWWKPQNGSIQETRRLGEVALARNHGDIRPLLVLGILQKWAGNSTTATHLFERAIAGNPTCAAAYANLGSVHLLGGDIDRAMSMLKTAEALSPFDPELFWIYGQMATAAYIAGKHDEALRHAANSLSLQSRYTLPALIAVNCHQANGEPHLARRARRHAGLADSRMVEHALALMPFKEPRHGERLREAVLEASKPA